MEHKNILTIEDLLKATEALKDATAELAVETESFANAAAESAKEALSAPAPAAAKSEAALKADVQEEGAEEKAPEEVKEVSEAEEIQTSEEVSEAEEASEMKTVSEAEETPETEEPKAETKAPKKTRKATNAIFTIIRLVLVVALVAAIVYFAFLKNQESQTPASEVFKKVEQTVHTDKMEKTTDRYFKKYYGLNAADYDAVLYYAPVSNMDAEELLVVKLKDVSQAEAVTDAIQKRQSDKEQSFEGYAPEQYALAQAYILDAQGNYILFVVDPKAEEIDAAFAGAL